MVREFSENRTYIPLKTLAIPAEELEAKEVSHLQRLTALKARSVLLGPFDAVTNNSTCIALPNPH
jgi:hypothetical protein